MKIVRLAANVENSIADLAEKSAAERASADVLELEIAEEAGKYIERFLAGDQQPFKITS